MIFVNITEHYFSMDTLHKFLIENSKTMSVKHWKSLFFQILFMLHKITHRLKQFRHNKLDLNSIWVYKRKDTESMKEFIINDVKFEVPLYNFEIKITDFDNSTSLDIPNIKKMNDNQYGLSSGVYTSNLSRGLRVSKAIRAGITFVNTYRLISPSAPFGGIKDSGYGKEAGIESIKDYTRVKTTWFYTSDEPSLDPFSIR